MTVTGKLTEHSLTEPLWCLWVAFGICTYCFSTLIFDVDRHGLITQDPVRDIMHYPSFNVTIVQARIALGGHAQLITDVCFKHITSLWSNLLNLTAGIPFTLAYPIMHLHHQYGRSGYQCRKLRYLSSLGITTVWRSTLWTYSYACPSRCLNSLPSNTLKVACLGVLSMFECVWFIVQEPSPGIL